MARDMSLGRDAISPTLTQELRKMVPVGMGVVGFTRAHYARYMGVDTLPENTAPFWDRVYANPGIGGSNPGGGRDVDCSSNAPCATFPAYVADELLPRLASIVSLPAGALGPDASLAMELSLLQELMQELPPEAFFVTWIVLSEQTNAMEDDRLLNLLDTIAGRVAESLEEMREERSSADEEAAGEPASSPDEQTTRSVESDVEREVRVASVTPVEAEFPQQQYDVRKCWRVVERPGRQKAKAGVLAGLGIATKGLGKGLIAYGHSYIGSVEIDIGGSVAVTGELGLKNSKPKLIGNVLDGIGDILLELGSLQFGKIKFCTELRAQLNILDQQAQILQNQAMILEQQATIMNRQAADFDALLTLHPQNR